MGGSQARDSDSYRFSGIIYQNLFFGNEESPTNQAPTGLVDAAIAVHDVAIEHPLDLSDSVVGSRGMMVKGVEDDFLGEAQSPVGFCGVDSSGHDGGMLANAESGVLGLSCKSSESFLVPEKLLSSLGGCGVSSGSFDYGFQCDTAGFYVTKFYVESGCKGICGHEDLSGCSCSVRSPEAVRRVC